MFEAVVVVPRLSRVLFRYPAMKLFRKTTLYAVLVIILFISTVTVLSIPETRWRSQVVALKVQGHFPELSWGALFRMLKPSSGYWLKPLVKSKNLYSAITNPFGSDLDVSAGEETFLLQCSICHGTDGSGVSAPSLKRGEFRNGDSDWALYLTITKGIPNTAMFGHELTEKEAWQVVSYLRSLVKQSGALDSIITDSGDSISKYDNGISAFNPVSYERLLGAVKEPENWMSYSGTFNSQRHSPLTQINQSNVGNLQVEWVYQMATNDWLVETTPLVVDGIMYLTEPPNNVLALNAQNGELIWSYIRNISPNISLCCGRINRGVAILGERIYLGTLDAHLVALDAKSGKVQWDVKVAEPTDGYSITSAPLAIKDKIITGIAGGEFGIRGFIDAYNPDYI